MIVINLGADQRLVFDKAIKPDAPRTIDHIDDTDTTGLLPAIAEIGPKPTAAGRREDQTIAQISSDASELAQKPLARDHHLRARSL